MLFLFFLRRFFYIFFLFLFLITVILGVGNVFIKLSMFTSVDALWFIFLALIPLMGIFAFPIAAGLAVHTTVGNLMVEDQLLMVHFFSSAKRSLWASVLVFSFAITAAYIPLTFYWAPQSYWAGKRALLQLAKRQFFQFEANKFHTPFPGVTVFFKQKNIEKNIPHYSTIFLSFNNKQGERYLFTAQQGMLENNCLYLHHGSVYTINIGKHYFATFEQTEINLSKIFNLEKDLLQGHQAKFLTMAELKSNSDQESSFEFHKRVAQMLWLLFFPILALMSVLAWGGRKSNLLQGLSFNGVLFLVSYVSMSLAHVMWTHFYSAAIFLYAFLLAVFGLILTLYLKKN